LLSGEEDLELLSEEWAELSEDAAELPEDAAELPEEAENEHPADSAMAITTRTANRVFRPLTSGRASRVFMAL
jgi:hypothetical protein